MKKYLKIGSILLGGAMALSIVGCKTQKNDPESRTFTMSITKPDGKFNPFFSTSQSDAEVIANTQISMMTVDSNGNPVCGENWDTVALDYSKQFYTAGGEASVSGDLEGTTEYKFLIKNGIKFSDGEDLTIKDVLFNLYVYLDPAYNGSSTIYSTEIVGLAAYRTQDENATETTTRDMYTELAEQKVNDMILHYADINHSQATQEEIEEYDSYAEIAKTFYKEALDSYFIGISSSFADAYQKEYRFTEAWEAYFYEMDGAIVRQFSRSGEGTITYLKDANGKYYTTFDPIQTGCDPSLAQNTNLKELMDEALTSEKISAYASSHNMTNEAAREALMQETAVDLTYENETGTPQGLASVISMVASDLISRIASNMRSAAFADGLNVDSVSGITVEKTNTFNGAMSGQKTYDEEHYVLKIVVKGVDAKAIWNFSYVVAPMHYYASALEAAKFNCKGVDGYDSSKQQSFGVKWSDADYFSDTLSAGEKTGVPVGAGPYKASSASFGDDTSRTKFYDNSYVYYVRNDYFTTVGSGIENAKIKKVQYRVATGDNILNLLTSGALDYAMPDAKSANVTEVNSHKDTLAYQTYDTGGFGYIGINPKYVENIQVRRAIIKAMNINLAISQYYTDALATTLSRPMSSTSWASPDYNGKGEVYVSKDNGTSYAFTSNEKEIQAIVNAAGYTDRGLKNDAGLPLYSNANGDKLEFTFTIAGETTDHPAYAIFNQAEQILEKSGFNIVVKNDINALANLAKGELAVWAAAWSSSVDPDMYQVHHKDSTATSVKNWYYDGIVYSSDSKWNYEREIIYELSDVIDEARQSDNQDYRTGKYYEALDLVMELAVELATYQRKDLAVYNVGVVDPATLNQNPNYNRGLIDKLWEVNYI